ncbi:MAG: hypothetical protein VXZ39_12800 [Planctomycetota bacterium]|nr:hypothetical protein [Planctomycetota bacterium]
MTADASTAAARAPLTEPRGARVSLRPATGAGVVLAVLLGALPAAVVGLESAWLIVVTALACLAMAPLLARSQALSVEVANTPRSLRLHAGRTTPLSLELTAHGDARGLLLDVGVGGPSRAREGAPRLAVPRLHAGAGTRVTIPVRFGARGHHDAATLRVASSFPFSLVHAARAIHLPLGVTVLPRLLAPAERTLLEQFVRTTLVGESTDRAARKRTSGLPVGLRHARPGDRARDIDARASVRKARWTAFDRSDMHDDREIAVGLVLRVKGRASSSRRRGHLAFEAAVAHCASAVELLVRAHGAVTLEEFLPAQEPLDEHAPAALEPGAVVSRIRRGASTPLLDRLAAVHLDGAHLDEDSGARAQNARRQGPLRRVVFLPLSPLEFQRAAESPAARKAFSDAGSTWIIGVDGSGRALRLSSAEGSSV